MKSLPSIGWFIESEDDVEFVEDVTMRFTHYCHVSFYERQHAEDYFELCLPYSEKINSIHLPKGLHLSDYKKGGLVHEMYTALGVKLFNVHPWADDLTGIVQEIIDNQDYTLCLETFSLKKPGNAGNPLFLLSHFGGYMLQSDKIRLTIDLSHLDNEVANYVFVRSLLPYSGMIHMSCRLKNNQHLPIFAHQSDVNARNIVGQVLSLPDCPIREIVLEYMREYRPQLEKHIWWLNDLINSKRRRFEKK